jgi:hypothetical protein
MGEGIRSINMDEREAILSSSLLDERNVDIVTTAGRSGTTRTAEIWTTVVDG